MDSKSEISNIKLLVHPIDWDIFYFEQDVSGKKKSVRDEELISRKAEHVSITYDLTVHFGQCISTKDPFVRSAALLIVYWQTVYVYTRSTRYVIDFSTAARKRASQASTNYSVLSGSSFAGYGHLLIRASCRHSDQFSNRCQEKEVHML